MELFGAAYIFWNIYLQITVFENISYLILFCTIIWKKEPTQPNLTS